MDEEDKVMLDYTTDPLITDESFQKKILSDIARAGDAIEKLYGTPQDIEGVIRDGKLYVVQTRPQVWSNSPTTSQIVRYGRSLSSELIICSIAKEYKANAYSRLQNV